MECGYIVGHNPSKGPSVISETPHRLSTLTNGALSDDAVNSDAESANMEGADAASRPVGGTPLQGRFLRGNLMRHVAVMSLTSSIGLVAMFLVDFVDLFFIAQLGDPALTAGMGFAATLLFLNSALNIGMMITISALGSRRIGRGDGDSARELLTQLMIMGICISALLAAIFWTFAPELMALLGAKGDAQAAAVQYIRITAPFGPVAIAGMVGSGLLRAHGDARRAMNTTLAMAAGNAIFDPLLIFGLDMGFAGAAWATVISFFLMAVAALVPIMRVYGGFAKPSRAHFAANFPEINAIMWPAILTNLATPVGGMITFRLLSDFGEGAIAGYAVIGRIVPLAFCLLFSLSGSVGPIVGQNYGAGQTDRVRKAIEFSCLFALGYIALVWPVLVLSADLVADIFNVPPDGTSLIRIFAWVATPLFAFNGILFISNAAFNNLDKPNWSAIINWARNTLGIVPFAIIGAQFYGAEGIVVGTALGGVIFGIIAFVLTRRLVDQIDPARG